MILLKYFYVELTLALTDFSGPDNSKIHDYRKYITSVLIDSRLRGNDAPDTQLFEAL